MLESIQLVLNRYHCYQTTKYSNSFRISLVPCNGLQRRFLFRISIRIISEYCIEAGCRHRKCCWLLQWRQFDRKGQRCHWRRWPPNRSESACPEQNQRHIQAQNQLILYTFNSDRHYEFRLYQPKKIATKSRQFMFPSNPVLLGWPCHCYFEATYWFHLSYCQYD